MPLLTRPRSPVSCPSTQPTGGADRDTDAADGPIVALGRNIVRGVIASTVAVSVHVVLREHDVYQQGFEIVTHNAAVRVWRFSLGIAEWQGAQKQASVGFVDFTR